MLKKIKSLFILLPLVSIQLQGCASIFNSGSQSVMATPSGGKENIAAEIKTPSGQYTSKLPTTIVTNPSSFDLTSVIVKDKCYEPNIVQVGKTITPAFWANFLLLTGFPIGMGIDFLTGNMWKMNSQVLVPVTKKPNC